MLQEIDLSGMSFVYFDLDGMKQANTQYGKAEVNRKIKSAMHFRESDIVVGQVFSGDEFVALVPIQDAYGFARRLQDSLTEHKLSATILVSNENDIVAGEDKLAKIKDSGFRAIIVDER